MPTYDYKCESCGRTFEFFQSMNDARLETCIYDDCKGAVRRLLGTGAGIIFKGSGFYETDYRSDSYKKGKETAEKSSSDTKPSSDTKGASDSSGSKDKKKSDSSSASTTGKSSSGTSTSTGGAARSSS